jgi:hypothetical protein
MKNPRPTRKALLRALARIERKLNAIRARHGLAKI